MRWACLKFALFAVIVLAAGVFNAAPPVSGQTKEASETRLLWTDDSEEPRPGSRPNFFVRVSGDQDTRPTGSVVVRVDSEAKTHALTVDDVDAEGNLAKKTAVFPEFLKQDEAHRIETTYAGDDAVEPSADLLHVPKGTLTAEYAEPYVVWTFTLTLRPGTPSAEVEAAREDKSVSFAIDDKVPQAVPLGGDLRATLRTFEATGNHRAIANYSGDLNFQPVQASAFIHVPESSAPSPPATTTPPRPTTTTRRPTRRVPTPTTAALAPINPGGTATTIAGDTTSTFESFGDFTTIPSTTGQLSTAANNDGDGPPIAVVATTLLALGVLGGVAAFRRYRKGGIDWF